MKRIALALAALAMIGGPTPVPYERPAIEAGLIGMCQGRLMAAQEESAFPASCDWIEPIRYE